jgi:hypothetical protein
MAKDYGSDLADEFRDAKLGDPRRVRRLSWVAERVGQSPGLSFPKIASNPSELEAMYRFFGNEHVEWEAVLAPHVEATVARCEAEPVVLVVHDTTEFSFATEDAREGMGYLTGGGRGFEGHFALAVSPEGTGVPLGVLGMLPQVRKERSPKIGGRPVKRVKGRPRNELEADRWRKLAVSTERRIPEATRKVHVMDSAADSYPLFCELIDENISFVIRGHYDRHLEGKLRLSEHLNTIESRMFREVPISARKGHAAKHRKRSAVTRNARQATLHIKTTSLELPRPLHDKERAPSLSLNVVQVKEHDVPEGMVPVEWMLLTTEPVDTPEAAERVVDIYRARWRIEELFKALKTGCAYESRQLMSMHALLNALAVLIPIAWRLLVLRHLSRAAEDVPASNVLTPEEVVILRAMSKRVRLGPSPTAQDALCAIAGLGGHLKQNGPPGWQTIWAGFATFSIAVEAWRAAKTSDQS